ncbi:hypothetical protein NUW58_g9689 [Xylaria curta]|uniref:Uncharacterized protein n=1 Tax=Xylaria curta TaxID=42375 RepID=A0ACC1MW33_9PEZI|nr:hypothetical protein NUW58_g9689 [Xylaria curta]
MVAHHLKPQPLALLSITGIPTFRHRFYNSSTLVSSELLTKTQVEKCLSEPVSVGSKPASDPSVFYLESLTKCGAKKANYERPKSVSEPPSAGDGITRGGLYEYFVHENAYPPMLDSLDPGYEWAIADPECTKLADWPTTIFIHGDSDPAVDIDVAIQAATSLGPKKASLFVAKGQAHLFEATCFLEDEGVGMDAVRHAVKALDGALLRARLE